MRKGTYPCTIQEGTLLHKAYGEDIVNERHRHRYEFNNEYIETLKKRGMVISGTYVDKCLVEAVELENHPWFVAVQFHPEFKSRPQRPHPLFCEFIGSVIKNKA